MTSALPSGTGVSMTGLEESSRTQPQVTNSTRSPNSMAGKQSFRAGVEALIGITPLAGSEINSTEQIMNATSSPDLHWESAAAARDVNRGIHPSAERISRKHADKAHPAEQPTTGVPDPLSALTTAPISSAQPEPQPSTTMAPRTAVSTTIADPTMQLSVNSQANEMPVLAGRIEHPSTSHPLPLAIEGIENAAQVHDANGYGLSDSHSAEFKDYVQSGVAAGTVELPGNARSEGDFISHAAPILNPPATQPSSDAKTAQVARTDAEEIDGNARLAPSAGTGLSAGVAPSAARLTESRHPGEQRKGYSAADPAEAATAIQPVAVHVAPTLSLLPT